MNKFELPDPDEMMSVIEEIYNISLEKSTLEVKLKTSEAEIFKTATTDPRFFQLGKAPSQAYIENTWRFGGFNGELLPQRIQLAELTSRVDFLRNKLSLMKDLIEVWRTESANARTMAT